MSYNRKMKIVIVGRDFPTKENNMCGSFEFEQAMMLAKAGHEVYYPYIDLRSIRHWRRFGITKELKNNVTVIGVNIPVGILLPANLRNKLYRQLWRWTLNRLEEKAETLDIVHVHYPAFQYVFSKKIQENGTKLIGTEHWTQVQNKTLPPECRKRLRDFTENADLICCVSSLLKASIIELTDTKKEIRIIPNVVNSGFKYIKQEHDGFRFFAAGRLVPVKQFDKMIEAFLNVFQGQSEVTLTLAGDGEKYKDLAEIIKRRKAEEQVKLLGVVSREKMAELMTAADVLVVYSELETFCVPVIEAWTCGKPVIATTTTVLIDNSDPRLGIMVDHQDLRSLEDALLYIHKHYMEYDSVWISEYAKEHFSEEAVCKKLVSMYREVMEDVEDGCID